MAMKRFAMVLALCGCAGWSGAPVPQAARLSAEVLTVTLSNGAVCRADWPTSAPLQGCGSGMTYTVSVDQSPNILRKWVQELALALNGQSTVPPYAQVVITDAAGRDWRFASPPPVEMN
jgi:hypothetical protein